MRLRVLVRKLTVHACNTDFMYVYSFLWPVQVLHTSGWGPWQERKLSLKVREAAVTLASREQQDRGECDLAAAAGREQRGREV